MGFNVITNTIINGVHHSTHLEVDDDDKVLLFPNFERARKYAIHLVEDALENLFDDGVTWTADIFSVHEQSCVSVSFKGGDILYTITIQEVNA